MCIISIIKEIKVTAPTPYYEFPEPRNEKANEHDASFVSAQIDLTADLETFDLAIERKTERTNSANTLPSELFNTANHTLNNTLEMLEETMNNPGNSSSSNSTARPSFVYKARRQRNADRNAFLVTDSLDKEISNSENTFFWNAYSGPGDNEDNSDNSNAAQQNPGVVEVTLHSPLENEEQLRAAQERNFKTSGYPGAYKTMNANDFYSGTPQDFLLERNSSTGISPQDAQDENDVVGMPEFDAGDCIDNELTKESPNGSTSSKSGFLQRFVIPGLKKNSKTSKKSTKEQILANSAKNTYKQSNTGKPEKPSADNQGEHEAGNSPTRGNNIRRKVKSSEYHAGESIENLFLAHLANDDVKKSSPSKKRDSKRRKEASSGTGSSSSSKERCNKLLNQQLEV